MAKGMKRYQRLLATAHLGETQVPEEERKLLERSISIVAAKSMALPKLSLEVVLFRGEVDFRGLAGKPYRLLAINLDSMIPTTVPHEASHVTKWKDGKRSKEEEAGTEAIAQTQLDVMRFIQLTDPDSFQKLLADPRAAR